MNRVHPLHDPSITWLSIQELTDLQNQLECERRAKLERFDKVVKLDDLPDIAHKRMSKSKYER